MICLNCRKAFIVKRTINDLFDKQNYLICDKCLRNNPFKIQEDIIPLDNHILRITNLFDMQQKNVFKAFDNEFEHIFQNLYNKYPNYHFIKVYNYVLNNENLREISHLSKELNKDIWIICFRSKIAL